jgi:hypothetical protein
MEGKRPLAIFKRASNIEVHPELTEINLENLQIIDESEYEHIPAGNTAQNTALPRQFRYYYDYAGRRLGYMLDKMRINFFKTSTDKMDVFTPSDVYVLSHVYDMSGVMNTSRRAEAALRFKSEQLFGPQVDNLTIFKNIMRYSSDKYRRVIDDIDPQLAYLMWMDFTHRREWHALFTLAFKGRYNPPEIFLANPMLYTMYVMSYFLLSHAVYNSSICDVAEGNFYRAPKNKKRVCFTMYRERYPNFFDDPYIHDKLAWAIGSDFNEPAINTLMYDLLINPFRNTKAEAEGGRRRRT